MSRTLQGQGAENAVSNLKHTYDPGMTSACSLSNGQCDIFATDSEALLSGLPLQISCPGDDYLDSGS